MKKIDLQLLTDVNDMSWVLDRSLLLLANSPVNLRLSQLCQATGLPPSALTRMKNLHINPQYEPFVNQLVLFNLLRYLFLQFPTLVLGRARDGALRVRLYRSYGGHKLVQSTASLSQDTLLKKNAPKPGTTRWFLEQMNQERISGTDFR